MAHFFGQIGGIWREVGGEGVVVDLQHVAQAAIAEGQVRVEVEKVDLKIQLSMSSLSMDKQSASDVSSTVDGTPFHFSK